MAFTTVTDAQIETNDWISTGPFTDICDNEDYNHSSQVSIGESGNTERYAIARGRYQFDVSNRATPFFGGDDDFYAVGNITFAVDAIDGDPKFIDTPAVLFTVEDRLLYPATDTYWYDDNIEIRQEMVTMEKPCMPLDASFWKLTGLTQYGFSYQIMFHTTARRDLYGYIHWLAFGPVAVI